MNIINPLLQLLLRRPYGVHSPFLYAFACACLYRSHQKDEVECMNRIVSGSLQHKKYYRLFYRMAAFLQPATILDLGTSPGVAAACFAKGYPQATVLTLDGCSEVPSMASEVSSTASDVLSKADVNNVSCIAGHLADVLPGLLEVSAPIDMAYLDGDHALQWVIDNFYLLSKHMSPEGVVILDGIRRSRQKWQAWRQASADPRVRLSVDLGTLGIMFFSHKLSKQNVFLGF